MGTRSLPNVVKKAESQERFKRSMELYIHYVNGDIELTDKDKEEVYQDAEIELKRRVKSAKGNRSRVLI